MLKIGTTFSGIGAPEQALKNLKIPHVVKWACDIDKRAKETYMTNHTCEKWYDDITKININELEYVDLYVFGFPCTDVSIYGKKDLSLGRTSLVKYSLDIIEKIRPKYIVFENVKNILSKKFQPFFQEIVDSISKNYNFSYKVLNSINFGVPQNRNRVFGVGVRKDLDIKFTFPQSKEESLNLQNILQVNVPNKYYLTDGGWAKNQEHKKRNLEKGNGFGYRILTDKAFCLLSQASYAGRQFIIDNLNKNPRMLTPRECASLQGFSDDFKIHSSDNVSYFQFGNTITVTVLEAIFNNLLNCD